MLFLRAGVVVSFFLGAWLFGILFPLISFERFCKDERDRKEEKSSQEKHPGQPQSFLLFDLLGYEKVLL